jgi:hypothetical protein
MVGPSPATSAWFKPTFDSNREQPMLPVVLSGRQCPFSVLKLRVTIRVCCCAEGRSSIFFAFAKIRCWHLSTNYIRDGCRIPLIPHQFRLRQQCRGLVACSREKKHRHHISCRRHNLQQEAAQKPRLLQTAKRRVALRVRASRAAWFRDEEFLTGLPIVTAGKFGGTAGCRPRGLFRTHRALPSFVCSSQACLETSVSRKVVCLVEVKWVFASYHLFPIVLR